MCEHGRGQRALALTWVCTGVEAGMCEAVCARVCEMCAWGCEGVCALAVCVRMAEVVSEALGCASFTVAGAETPPSPWQ